MGYDLGRATTAVVACLAVALAAMLLPAAGVGSYPGLVGDVAPETGATGGPAVPDPDSTPAPTAEPKPTADPGETTTSEATETATPTATPTDSAGTGGGSDENGGQVLGALLATLVAVVEVAATVTLALGLLLGVGLAIGGVTGGPVRLHDSDGSLLLSVFGLRVPLGGLRGISRGSMRAVLGVSRSASTLLSGLGSVAAGVAGAVGGGGSVLGALGGALRAAGRGLARGLEAGARALGSLSLGLGALTAGLSNWRPGFDRGDSPAADARDAGPVPTPDESPETTERGPRTVEEAWSRFVERVPLSRPEVRTPGEVARTAVRNDLPAGPVRRLTNAFREVRYGDAPADDDRTAGAVAAYDEMDDDDGGDPA